MPAISRLAAILASALLLSSCSGDKEVELDLRHPSPHAVGVGDPKAGLDALLKRVDAGELPRVEFDAGSDALGLESRPTLDAIAELLIKNPSVKTVVVARADFFGTDDYNLKLSQRRAKAVTSYLASRGVAPVSLRWRGLGRSSPLADNATEAGRKMNRSVEFRFSTRDWDASW